MHSVLLTMRRFYIWYDEVKRLVWSQNIYYCVNILAAGGCWADGSQLENFDISPNPRMACNKFSSQS